MANRGLFRSSIKKEFVEEILVFLQFLGLHDRKLFSKNDIAKEKFEEIITWIEPYYVPCKAKRFLYDTNRDNDSSHYITVIRHLLREVGYDLLAQEKLVNSKKITLYQIYQTFINVEATDMYVMDFA